MSAFEFFFSFYGLLLGLSVAVIATGLATAIQHRRTIRIGWMTPMLALFVALDIASFWDSAWINFRHLPFSYGLLAGGLLIALIYFVAASLVFPHQVEDGTDLSAHFWANKRIVLVLTTLANLLLVGGIALAQRDQPDGATIISAYTVTMGLYVLLSIPAILARKPTLFAIAITLHILVYVLTAVMTFVAPELIGPAPNAYAETPPG